MTCDVPLRLTQLTQAGGCGAKMAPDALAKALAPLARLFDPAQFPQLLVGLVKADDAAVYQVTDDIALIATTDFFPPVVDDPYEYGAVAAANAMSDVYAMGGRMALALNICCLSGCLPGEIMTEILRGGAEKVAEAGAVLVGGHSISDREPKYGLVALGFVHPQRIWTKGGANPGDALVLTKPLGVGLVTTAHKNDKAAPDDYRAAVDSMLKLNRAAAELLAAANIRACTDVTGFSLLGHACEMAEAGCGPAKVGRHNARAGVTTFRIRASELPKLPGVQRYAAEGTFPGGTQRNQGAFGPRVAIGPEIDDATARLMFTPETSGGLLAAVAPHELDALRARFAAANLPLWVIGDVQPAADRAVVVE